MDFCTGGDSGKARANVILKDTGGKFDQAINGDKPVVE